MVAGTATFASGAMTLDVEDTAPTGTGVATFLSGVAGFTIDGTPIPGGGITVAPITATLALFERDGKTKIGNAPLVRALEWLHQLSAAGSITFELPLDDPFTAEFTAKRIVKVYQNGRARMAARIDQSATDLAKDGMVWRRWDALPGVAAMAADGVVEAEFGQRPTTSATRTFGFMSRLDNWYLRSNMRVPQVLPMSADTGYRKNYPAGLKALSPSWISLLGAYAAQSANEDHFFHRRARVFSTFDYRFDFAFDHRGDVWIDGEQFAAKADAQGEGYRYLGTVRGTWEPGDHVIAADAQANGPNTAHQPIAFIGAMRILDANGDPVKGPPFIVTDGKWRVTDDVSGHHRAECVLRLWEECNQRLVALGQDGAFLTLHPGWTDTKDSAGLGWSDYGRRTVEIGQPLSEVLGQFTEGYINTDADAETMRLLMFKRAGTDRRGSVSLLLGQDGGNVKTVPIARIEPTANAALIQLADGDWVTDEDAGSIDDYGRAEIGLAVGSTSSESTADDTAEILFAETAHPSRVFSEIEISCKFGPQLYKDFFLGDTVTAVNEDGDTVPGRVMAARMSWVGETPTCQLTLVEDRS